MSEPTPEDGSTRTVLVAMGANAAVAVAKGVASVLTGSSALMAETIHSVADTANEALLFVGVRRSAPGPDQSHPFGHGQEKWFWSYLAALGIFLIGGLLAILEGVRALLQPEPLSSFLIGAGVLVVSMVFEGISWHRAYTQVRGEAQDSERTLAEHLQRSSDPTAKTVLYEDTAALIGLTLALAALVLHKLTGSGLYDAVASILIGLLLTVVAFLLGRHNQRLLIDASAPSDVVERIRADVGSSSGICAVPSLKVVWAGPRQLLVIADVVFEDGIDVVGAVSAIRGDLLAVPQIASVELTPVAPA